MAQILGLVFILLCYFGGIDLKGWMTSPTTALVFFGGLYLRLISKREIVRLSFFFILGSLITVYPIDVLFIFFDQWAMAFWAPGINFLNVKK